MSSKNKSVEISTKAKVSENVWKRAFCANTEWPDKVS